MRVDKVLAQLLPSYSRTRIQAWLQAQSITLAGNSLTPRQKVYAGQILQLIPQADPQQSAYQAEAIAFDVIFEDASLLVINKAAGQVVHPAAGHWQGTLLNGLLHRYPQLHHIPRAGIVHRLDKLTSGLMVVAKTLSAHQYLVQQLQARAIKRQYWAIVHGKPPAQGCVDAPIGRHPRDRVRMAVIAQGKQAITYYRCLHRYRDCSLLECQLHTGRTHQIRVHMQAIGHPLLGDPTYGIRPNSYTQALRELLADFHRQALHAIHLELIHPYSKQIMRWHAPPATDMQALLLRLQTTIDPD